MCGKDLLAVEWIIMCSTENNIELYMTPSCPLLHACAVEEACICIHTHKYIYRRAGCISVLEDDEGGGCT